MISVVLPTYNEADNVPIVLARLSDALRGREFEVVVVDDASPDGTATVAERAAENLGIRAVVIRRPGKLGLSSAIMHGIMHARGDVVVVMDADLQHPPEKVPELVEAIFEGADIAVASRYVPGGRVEGWPLYRRLVSRGAVVLSRLLIDKARPVRDPVSGFFALRKDVVRGVDIRPSGSYKVLLDILAKGRYKRVVEVPYVFGHRYRGRSKLGVGTILGFVLQVLKLSGWRPLKFAAVGSTGVAVAMAVLYLAVDRLGIQPLLGGLIAVETSILNNYVLNRHWTFRSDVGFVEGYLKYHAAVALGAVTNYAVYSALVLLGISIYVSYIVGVACGYLANYLMSEAFVFKK